MKKIQRMENCLITSIQQKLPKRKPEMSDYTQNEWF